MGCLSVQRACTADADEHAAMLFVVLSCAAFQCSRRVQRTPMSVLSCSHLLPFSAGGTQADTVGVLPCCFCLFVMGYLSVQQTFAADADECAATLWCLSWAAFLCRRHVLMSIRPCSHSCHGLPFITAGTCSRSQGLLPCFACLFCFCHGLPCQCSRHV
jgi:hypothetical protein